MESLFLPSFDYEPRNTGLVITDKLPPDARAYQRDGTCVPLTAAARTKLGSYRRFSQIIGPVGRNACGVISPTGDWDELAEAAANQYQQAIAHNTTLPGALYASREELKVVRRDVHAGIAQIMAFLAVIPEVATVQCPADPNGSLAEVARRSKRLILHGALLHDDADRGIAWGLASPKPRKSRFSEIYKGLRYGPDWFQYHPSGIVTLDAAKVQDLRNPENEHPNANARPTDIWFGCPAYPLISALYDGLVNLAEQGGLFETRTR